MPVNIECEVMSVELARAGGITNHVESRKHQNRSNDNIPRLATLLEATHIIPSVRSPEFLVRSARAPGKLVYFLFGNPEDIAEMVDQVAAAGKVPMVNVDLAAGLSRDEAAISYLAHRQVQGIISNPYRALASSPGVRAFCD